MGWKNWPSWLKGGLVAALAMFVILLYKYISNLISPSENALENVYIILAGWILIISTFIGVALIIIVFQKVIDYGMENKQKNYLLRGIIASIFLWILFLVIFIVSIPVSSSRLPYYIKIIYILLNNAGIILDMPSFGGGNKDIMTTLSSTFFYYWRGPLIRFFLFIISGAFIGWTYGKIKNRNQTQLNQNYIKSK